MVELVDETVEYGGALPAEVKLNLLRVGRFAGVGWQAVEQTERLDFLPTDGPGTEYRAPADGGTSRRRRARFANAPTRRPRARANARVAKRPSSRHSVPNV